jgi:hypothetical protein
MKLTKQTLKRIIKEELEAVMGEQDGQINGKGLAIELERAGAYQQNPQRTQEAGVFDINNNYLAFDDGDTTRVYYLPNEMNFKNVMPLIQKFGFSKGSIAIEQSNLGAPKEYEQNMKNKNPNRRLVRV